MSSTPLLSVIIPTHKRPQFLPCAIDSALLAAPDGDVEVIVVPNGPDESWKAVAKSFKEEPRIQWHPIQTAHACAARNHGLILARGKFIRFLDDDDALIAEGAQTQCMLLERTGADVCSAPIYALDGAGNRHAVLYQPDTPDFVAGLLSHKRMHQPTAHIFLSEAVQKIQWDESLKFSQDNDWMLRLAAQSELLWVKSEQVAGKWRQHTDSRISTNAPQHARKRIVAERAIGLVRVLENRDALTLHRREAAALGLWDCVHQALFAAPDYWLKIAHIASELAPGSHPDLPMHNMPWSSLGLPPLTLEILIAPKRLAAYGIRRVLLSSGLLQRW